MPEDLGFWAAVCAAAVAFFTSFTRYRAIAIAAALIACAAVASDYYYTFRYNRLFLDEGDFQGFPLGWSGISINNARLYPPGSKPNINSIGLLGSNVGDKEIKLDDIYFISGITGARLDAKIDVSGAQYGVQEINPIPPGALLFVTSDKIGPAQGLTVEEFLNVWSIVYFVAEYNGAKQKITFDRRTVHAMLPQRVPSYPHTTLRKPAD